MVVRSLQIALHSATSARDFVPTPRTRAPAGLSYTGRGARLRALNGAAVARGCARLDLHALPLVRCCTTCNRQHATCNVQHATCSVQHATCNGWHTAWRGCSGEGCNRQTGTRAWPACNRQQWSACNRQQMRYDVQSANGQRAARAAVRSGAHARHNQATSEAC